MINWESIHYDIGAATRDFNKLSCNASSMSPITPRRDLTQIRQDLIDARDKIFVDYQFDDANKLDYQFDVLFGLKLYQTLNEFIGFTNRISTNDDVWRYLSICVVPDIVHSRWGLNQDHFYNQPRRIWLKSIWWYIHLSWIGSEDATYGLLKNNTTDTLLQLVERPGIGYYIDLYRELMLQYSKHEDKSRELFRRVLKLNTAQLITTSPELVKGGIESYVSNLFNAMEESDAADR